MRDKTFDERSRCDFSFNENLRASRELILQPNEEKPGSIRTDGHALEYLLRRPRGHHLVSGTVAERAQKVGRRQKVLT
jgi:hypothetical protein